MTFNIIGTGNIAWFLAQTLTVAGHTCLGIYGRDIEKTAELANSIKSSSYSISNGVPDNADVCILAVSDNAVEVLATSIKLQHSVLIHTSGSIDIQVLKMATENCGVIWPVYSILKSATIEERSIPIVWEANTAKTTDIILQIANSFTDIVHQANSAQRKWLHLTAVFSNNFTNHIFAICEKICTESDLPFDLLYPIINQTISRIHSQSPFDTQTGPAKRADTTTLKQHEEMLNNHQLWQKIYRAISESIATTYTKKETE